VGLTRKTKVPARRERVLKTKVKEGDCREKRFKGNGKAVGAIRFFSSFTDLEGKGTLGRREGEVEGYRGQKRVFWKSSAYVLKETSRRKTQQPNRLG